MSIVTLTLNAAIDQTITLDGLMPGHVQRARSVHYNAGGKGVNAASCLADWGCKVTAAGILGRENAALFESLFHRKGIDDRFIRVGGASRMNVKLVDLERKETTDINLPGIELDSDSLIALDAVLKTLCAQAPKTAVLAGNLPAGCPLAMYAELTEKLTKAGVKVILDTSGPALQKALAAETLPYCVKPNHSELSEWSGREINDEKDLQDQTKALRERGVRLVVVSLGEKGALFSSEEGMLMARAAVETIVSTVGAGDAMVAGIAAALDENASLERIARLSTAFSAAKLGVFGPNLPSKAAVEASAGKVEIRRLAGSDPVRQDNSL